MNIWKISKQKNAKTQLLTSHKFNKPNLKLNPYKGTYNSNPTKNQQKSKKAPTESDRLNNWRLRMFAQQHSGGRDVPGGCTPAFRTENARAQFGRACRVSCTHTHPVCTLQFVDAPHYHHCGNLQRRSANDCDDDIISPLLFLYCLHLGLPAWNK